MVEANYIRFLGNNKDSSYAEIARKVGRDTRTVKKYLDKEDWAPKEKIPQQRPARVMDPVKHIVDQWLLEDLKKNKKYRRTAKRMYDLLCKEHGFKGAYRTVRHYISLKKKELLEDRECSLPLESRPGTAQVDFGQTPFKYQGKEIHLSYLVLSFPYSNSFYFQVFWGQNKECLFEGLRRIFNHIGGVPRVIRFDNLSPVVKKVLPHGERELTEEFYHFATHYNFEYEFCNPGKGNEKGHVEAMVKYIRNNFLLPEPTVHDLEQYNQRLWKLAEDDRSRPHYDKGVMISTLFAEDKNHLFMLPNHDYEGCRYVRVKADKYGKISFESNTYSSSPRFAKSYLMIKVTHNQVEILDEKYNHIITHQRLYGKNEESMKWQPYLNLMAKRPMAIKYTSFYCQLPQEWQSYLTNCTTLEKQEALKLLSSLLKDTNIDHLTQALVVASRSGHPSTDAIKQVFLQIVHGRGTKEPLKLRSTLPQMPTITRNLNRYDQLMGKGIH